MIEDKLSADEVVRVAIGMERQGIDFYSRMAEVSKIQNTRDTFLELAEDEKDHLKTFSDLLDEISKGTVVFDWATPDQVSEIEAYLRSLIKLQTFGEEETKNIVSGALSVKDALSFAIHAERDAIVYYGGAAQCASSGRAKDIFERIAVEERKHLVSLTERLLEL